MGSTSSEQRDAPSESEDSAEAIANLVEQLSKQFKDLPAAAIRMMSSNLPTRNDLFTFMSGQNLITAEDMANPLYQEVDRSIQRDYRNAFRILIVAQNSLAQQAHKIDAHSSMLEDTNNIIKNSLSIASKYISCVDPRRLLDETRQVELLCSGYVKRKEAQNSCSLSDSIVGKSRHKTTSSYGIQKLSLQTLSGTLNENVERTSTTSPSDSDKAFSEPIVAQSDDTEGSTSGSQTICSGNEMCMPITSVTPKENEHIRNAACGSVDKCAADMLSDIEPTSMEDSSKTFVGKAQNQGASLNQEADGVELRNISEASSLSFKFRSNQLGDSSFTSSTTGEVLSKTSAKITEKARCEQENRSEACCDTERTDGNSTKPRTDAEADNTTSGNSSKNENTEKIIQETTCLDTTVASISTHTLSYEKLVVPYGKRVAEFPLFQTEIEALPRSSNSPNGLTVSNKINTRKPRTRKKNDHRLSIPSVGKRSIRIRKPPTSCYPDQPMKAVRKRKAQNNGEMANPSNSQDNEEPMEKRQKIKRGRPQKIGNGTMESLEPVKESVYEEEIVTDSVIQLFEKNINKQANSSISPRADEEPFIVNLDLYKKHNEELSQASQETIVSMNLFSNDKGERQKKKLDANFDQNGAEEQSRADQHSPENLSEIQNYESQPTSTHFMGAYSPQVSDTPYQVIQTNFSNPMAPPLVPYNALGFHQNFMTDIPNYETGFNTIQHYSDHQEPTVYPFSSNL